MMAPMAPTALAGPRHELSVDHEWYPAGLLNLADAPPVLYVVGNPKALKPGLAVVGARKATPYGLACTRSFAGHAASKGIAIVSGGAVGCDAEAHRAALDAGGLTVAVLGGGADQLYPAANKGLFQRVVDAGGAVVSEHAWDVEPKPFRFRLRNRLIAALTLATLVVEASLPSGTFSTADDALSLGREVMAVPGSICSKTSAGCNRLIYQGATPAIDRDSFDDCISRVFGHLRCEFAPAEPLAAGMEDDPLLAMLQSDPMRIDKIMAVMRQHEGQAFDEAATMMALSILEAKGLVARFPDGRYGPARV